MIIIIIRRSRYVEYYSRHTDEGYEFSVYFSTTHHNMMEACVWRRNWGCVTGRCLKCHKKDGWRIFYIKLWGVWVLYTVYTLHIVDIFLRLFFILLLCLSFFFWIYIVLWTDIYVYSNFIYRICVLQKILSK